MTTTTTTMKEATLATIEARLRVRRRAGEPDNQNDTCGPQKNNNQAWKQAGTHEIKEVPKGSDDKIEDTAKQGHHGGTNRAGVLAHGFSE